MATKTFPIVSAGALPKVLLVFLVGGFGGIAPTMLRIGVDLSQHHGSVAEINGSILLGMAIFFIMGGAVAAIWNEVDLKKVFYIGLGLPVRALSDNWLVRAEGTGDDKPGSAPRFFGLKQGGHVSPQLLGVFGEVHG